MDLISNNQLLHKLNNTIKKSIDNSDTSIIYTDILKQLISKTSAKYGMISRIKYSREHIFLHIYAVTYNGNTYHENLYLDEICPTILSIMETNNQFIKFKNITDLPNIDNETIILKNVLGIPLYCKNYNGGKIGLIILGNKKKISFNSNLDILFNIITQHMIEDIKNDTNRRFIENISHSMRTHLDGIIGLLILMTENNQVIDEKYNNLMRMKDSGFILMRILTDIIDFYKLEFNQISLLERKTNIHEFISSTIEIIQFQLEEKQIIFKYMIDNNVPLYINIDQDKLKQIILNLIDNAILNTPEKGKISLKIYKTNDGSKLEFKIKDNGIGISKEYQSRIFFPFFQLSKNHSYGVGLGLPIARKLVKLMGGKIWFESKLNHGSVFYFDIELKNVVNNVRDMFSRNILIFVDTSILQEVLTSISKLKLVPIVCTSEENFNTLVKTIEFGLIIANEQYYQIIEEYKHIIITDKNDIQQHKNTKGIIRTNFSTEELNKIINKIY